MENDDKKMEEVKAPEKDNILPFNPNKRKLAKQIQEKTNEIQDLQGKINMLNNIVMGQANFMNRLVGEIDEMKRSMVETSTAFYTLIESHLKVDMDEFQKNIDIKKIQLFEEGSAKEDLEKGYVAEEEGVVKETSIITLTSTIGTEGTRGILRSRINLEEPLSVPNLKEALVGMKVGEIKTIKINNSDHHITVLDIKKKIKPTTENTVA